MEFAQSARVVMGVVSTVFWNVAVLGLALSVTKRAGIVAVYPNKIRDENLRFGFVQFMHFSDTLVSQAESVVTSLTGGGKKK